MLAFSALVAGSFSLGSLIAALVPPVALTAVRFALAFAVMALLAMMTTGIPRGAFRAPWRHLVLGGVFATYFALMFEGLTTATPVATAAVFTMTPALSAVFAYLLLGQRGSPRLIAALLLGAAGALWVIFRGDPAALMQFSPGRGETIFLFGCVAHALYTPLVRLLHRGEGVLVFAAGTFLGGFLVLLLPGWRGISATDWAALPLQFWAVLAYLAVVTSALALILLHYAALRLPASKVMAYTYLVPCWVILWDMGIGRAAPPLRVVAGAALTTLALILLLRDEKAATDGKVP